MKKSVFIFLVCGAVHGQNVVFQQAGAITVTGRSIRMTDGAITVNTDGALNGFEILSGEFAGGQISGSPFTAMEQRHSLQILGDGTRIEQSDQSQITRDAEGRTRTETTRSGSDKPPSIEIQDPVAGTTFILDSVRKIANKVPAPKRVAATKAASVVKPMVIADMTTLQFKGPVRAPGAEDLGVQNINGVLARGTRTTINIPVGQIGNDRAIQVVNERWFSDELGMIVKSSNSDPRFGTTTYEFVNISRNTPDPSLFQVPADYTVNEGRVVVTDSVK